MANEFKIKNGLLLGVPATSQPVVSIKDTSISITTDASSWLATNKAIYDFVTASTPDVPDASISQNWERWIDSNRTGFLNQTDTSLSFDDSTFVFTLGDEGSGWQYYRDGIKYDISGDSSIRLTTSGTPAADRYFITIDSSNGELSVSTTPWDLDGTELLVAYVDFDNGNTPKYAIGEERHSMLIDRRIHKYLHETRGTQFVAGGTLTGPEVLAGDITVTDSSNAVGISQTEIADEDLFQILPALSRPNGATTSYFTFLRDGGNLDDWGVENLPFPESGGNIQYDNGTGMTAATDGKYVNSYIMFTNLTSPSGNARFAILPGQAEFDNVDTAIDENPAAFDFTGLPIAEYVIAWQLTWEVSTGYSTTGNVALASEPKRIEVNSATASSVTTEAHNDLLGLQGGNATERYHLTESEYNDYVGKTYVDGSLNSKQDDITFGTQNQVPKTNSAGDDFEYGLLSFNDKSVVAVDSSFNLFITEAWKANNGGFGNTGLGNSAGSTLDSGDSNTFVGFGSGANLDIGTGNTILGALAGGDLDSGNRNTLIGLSAGADLQDSSNNVMIGSNAGYNETGSYKLYIDSYAGGSGNDASSALIYGEFNGTRKLRVNAAAVEFNGITESTKSKLLYFDTASNRISYGNAPADVSTFIGLSDTPSSYNDASAGAAVVVNDSGDGLEFGPRIWREESDEVTLANEDANVLFYENIEIEADSGVGTFVDKSVTASSAADTEESYIFAMDGTTIAKIFAESDGAGSIKNEKFVSSVTFQAESSVYFTGIPEVSTGYALYYNPTTDEVTYAEASLGGGGGGGGTGDVAWASGQVGSDNYMITAAGDGSIVAESNLTFNGSHLQLDGSLSITGNLVVDGSATIINTTNLDVSDNIIYINTGMSGTPPSTMVSGLKIDRGSENPYFFIFSEDDDTFRIGTETDEASLPGDTQAVATREDAPITGGVAFWNDTEKRFDTSTNFTSDGKDVSIGGNVYMPGIQEVSTGQVIYYNETTGLLTYGDASTTGGGGSTYWTLDGSILRPSDETVNVELSAIQVNTDAGATTLVDMDVSSATQGTEESYAFNIDGTPIAKVYSEGDGNAGIQNPKFVSIEAFEAEASVYFTGIPESSQVKALYYNATSGEITYDDVSTGGAGGTATWGGITGNLEDQTDVSTAIDTKVSKSGDTMTGDLTVDASVIVSSYQYMGDPNTNGSWRFYVDGSGDLVFEKRIAGTWTEKGKFTE